MRFMTMELKNRFSAMTTGFVRTKTQNPKRKTLGIF